MNKGILLIIAGVAVLALFKPKKVEGDELPDVDYRKTPPKEPGPGASMEERSAWEEYQEEFLKQFGMLP